MNETELAILMLKGIVSEMPEDKQAETKACYEDLKSVVKKHGDYGFIALSLLGAELQEEMK